MGWRSEPDDDRPHQRRDQWVEMFKAEYLVRAGYQYDESTDEEIFDQFYGDTPHDAVMQLISKYGMRDLTNGKATVWYVVQDEEGVYLVDNNPGTDEVLWVGTDKFTAKQMLCRNCVD